MTISQLARSITASPTIALNEQARILREKGEPVINMGIGEPRNKAPINAILSSAAKITEGYLEIAQELDAHVAPAGIAFEKAEYFGQR